MEKVCFKMDKIYIHARKRGKIFQIKGTEQNKRRGQI